MDRDLLFKPRLPEDDVEVPGVGVVRVRGLNRIEAMHVQAGADIEETDRRVIAQGLVDPLLLIPGLQHQSDGKPCKACADAGNWQRASIAGELEPVTSKIAELSGMLPDSPKDAVKTFRGQPGPGVPILPSGEIGDDGSDPTDIDE